MHLTLDDKVALITGKEPNQFGTGFVIHKDQYATYLLTCTHVINAVGWEEALQVDYKPATVVAFDPEDGFDLAVLRVEGVLETPILPLKISALKDMSIITAGFSLYGSNQRTIQKISGTLHEQGKVDSARLQTRIICWHLKFEGEYLLERGYSGAPVVDAATNLVLGVINKRKGAGERGLAISIEALPKIWPEMPPELLAEPLLPQKKTQPREPLMNLTSELAAFEKIASHQDNEACVILVHGESGMGKTHLLRLYRQAADAHRLDRLDFSLGPQISIEDCLYQIVVRFGPEHFPTYDEFSAIGPPQPLTRQGETRWQRTLTQKVFTDLSRYSQAPRLVLFFDQYEKADPAFKSWLTQNFLPHISARYPIIVIIAGQEAITSSSSAKSHRHFHLTGVTVECYHEYVEKCQAALDPYVIDHLHKALQGRPKFFVEYVQSQLQPGGGV
ncbi:MAG: serine protease [Anaerolineae bacterium]|nr:serine protease [Anaerolineae bacterium]